MRRALILAAGAALVLACAATAATPTAAPSAAADPTIRAPGWKAPKTSWGAPDIGGQWSNATLTPLTRNPRLSAKSSLTAAEAKAMEKVWADALAEADAPTDQKKSTETIQAEAQKSKLLEIRPDFAAAGGDVGGYNTFWIDPGTHIMEVNGEFRTSIITTPNGQFPARKAGAPSGAAAASETSTTATRSAAWATAASWVSAATPARRCCRTATTTTTIRSCSRRTRS
jgi:hypothetical protein